MYSLNISKKLEETRTYLVSLRIKFVLKVIYLNLENFRKRETHAKGRFASKL